LLVVTLIEESTMAQTATKTYEHELHVRIQAEFNEMPGLKLTLPQASRLFNVDAGRCGRALDRLVDSGSLSIAGGVFMRSGGGRHCA
jgi:hypothetical protein